MVRDGKGALVDGCLLHCGAKSPQRWKIQFLGGLSCKMLPSSKYENFLETWRSCPACEDRRFVTCTVKQYWEP
jgi:hypothetical protein